MPRVKPGSLTLGGRKDTRLVNASCSNLLGKLGIVVLDYLG